MKSEAEAALALEKYAEPFESDAHEKAWLIRVSINACKDRLKSFLRRGVSSFEDMETEPFYIQEEDRMLLDAVRKLPDNYKNVIYLFYYEGYTAVEIAAILKKRENTVYTWLSRAKAKLKEELVRGCPARKHHPRCSPMQPGR